MRNKMFLLVGAAILALPAVVSAVVFPYGLKTGATVVYNEVQEDTITSATPLFNNPAIIGDTLVFTPTFGATTTGGGVNIEDSTLSTRITPKPNMNLGIQNIIYNEAGDYTLAGTGTLTTKATVSAPYFVRITEVNGVDLTAPIQVNGNLAFTPGTGAYDLPNHAGVGIIWTGSANISITNILVANQISGLATEVFFSIDNTLIAVSEAGSTSFIKKKTADGVTITIILPEPATLGLVGGAAITLLRRRR